MTKTRMLASNGSESVDAYITSCPKEVQSKLRAIRAAIRLVAPDATETTSYFGIPGYSYPGYDYNGMFAWFSIKEPNVRLHLRPPTIEVHAKQLAAYSKTKGIVSFPADKTILSPLIKKLVRASLDVMKAKSV
jgi:uncharacterized protein YdhG (YjbR/CyaY superfamily)